MDVNTVLIIGLMLQIGGVGYGWGCILDRIEKKLTQEPVTEDYETIIRAIRVQGKPMTDVRVAETMRKIEMCKRKDKK